MKREMILFLKWIGGIINNTKKICDEFKIKIIILKINKNSKGKDKK